MSRTPMSCIWRFRRGKVPLQSHRRKTMKTNYKLALTLLAGVALGGAAIEGIHAQVKQPAYVVFAIRKITDAEAFKEIMAKAPAAAESGCATFVIRIDKITSLDGTPPARFV